MSLSGKLVISLDFELSWGVLDRYPNGEYNSNLYGARKAIIEMLRVFQEFDVGVTWATVGFLFNADLSSAKQNLPKLFPSYDNTELSNYRFLDTQSVENNEIFFANDLIQHIKSVPRQEIASHTFSHYYCLEDGQTSEQFKCDLELFKSISSKHGLSVSSLVFPRNQINVEYLELLKEFGIASYRGNEDNWLNKPNSFNKQSIMLRAVRLLDSYLNITGDNSFSNNDVNSSYPYNVKASRFLRPSKNIFLDFLQERRILNSMRSAAKKGNIFHLWWHPHNFGENLDKNIALLRRILTEYKTLNEKLNFQSVSMRELSEVLGNG